MARKEARERVSRTSAWRTASLRICMAPKRTVPRAEGGKSTLLRYASPRRGKVATTEGEETDGGGEEEAWSPSTHLMPPPPPRRPSAKEASTSLFEVQETGERNQFEDDVFYLLSGAHAAKPAVRRSSLVQLTALCATKKAGRMMRATGTLEKVMECAFKNGWEDEVIALQAAALLFVLAQDPANVPKLSSSEAMTCLFELFIQPASGPQTKLLSDRNSRTVLEQTQKMFRVGGTLENTLHQHGLVEEVRISAPLLAVHVLESCTRAPESESALIVVEQFKASFCQRDGLEALVVLVDQLVQSLVAAKEGGERPLQVLECLMVSLQVLENITFLNEQGIRMLLALEFDSSTSMGSLRRAPCVQACLVWLRYLSASIEEECKLSVLALKSILALLVNLTNGSEEGCRQVARFDGLEAIGSTLLRLLESSAPSEEVSDTTNMALCLLINLVEKDEENRKTIARLTLHGEPLVRRLCRLVGPTGPLPTDYESEDEVTEEMLQKNERDGMRAMAQTYAALLLSFLVLGSAEVRQDVDIHLEGGLSSLPTLLHRLHQFHSSTHSMTAENMSTITDLIHTLQGQELS